MKGARPLTDVEVNAVQAQLGPRDRALFVLGIRTGFRVSELLSLRLGDVWQDGNVLEAVGVSRKSMKGRSEGRIVPLHQQARLELGAWAAVLLARGATKKSFLFPSREGGAISRFRAWAIMTAACRRAGVFGKTGTHFWRKTFACRIYEKVGHDLLKTQKALGHKAITSTSAYLSFAEAEVDAAILAPDEKC